MYKSIERNSNKEKFLDIHTSLEADSQNHAELRFFIKMGKGWTNSRFSTSALLKTYSNEIKPHKNPNLRKSRKR